MDQYRAVAYLDLLNGIPAETRIASGQLVTVGHTAQAAGERGQGGREDPESGAAARDGFFPESGPEDERPDGGGPDGGGPPRGPGGKGPRGKDPGGNGPGYNSPVGKGPGDNGPGGGGNSATPPARPGATPSSARMADLVLPLATLLGLAERPGEGHGLGPLDPQLCRELATAAAGSPWTRLCVTVTTPDGIAAGHGCARPLRKQRITAPPRTAIPAGGTGPPMALPARLNLTITAGRLAELTAATGPPGQAPWSFTPDNNPGPPGGPGSWTLTLPGGRQLTVPLEPVPAFDCDHRHESHAYQPNDALRHLVQVRDGNCTFPPCSRHAKDSDFEHAVPYDKGGRTCACNAGARSRACHQVKQSPGWNVAQPRPGWHQWTTPAGRTYTQGPKHYPA